MKKRKLRKPGNLKGLAYMFRDAPWVAINIKTEVITGARDMRKLAAFLIRCAEWVEAQEDK